MSFHLKQTFRALKDKVDGAYAKAVKLAKKDGKLSKPVISAILACLIKQQSGLASMALNQYKSSKRTQGEVDIQVALVHLGRQAPAQHARINAQPAMHAMVMRGRLCIYKLAGQVCS